MTEDVVLNMRAHGAAQVVADVGSVVHAMKAASKAQGDHVGAWTNLRNVIKQAGVEGGGWRSIFRQVATDTRTWRSALDGVHNTMKAVSVTARGLGTLLGLAARGAVAVGAAGVGFAGYGLKLAMSREETAISFKTWLGSQAAAEKMIAQNQKWADVSPWGLDEANGLAMQAMQAGIKAENVKAYMDNIGNAVAAVGGSSATLARVSENLTQMQALGKMDTMDFRQFSSAHIDARSAIAKALGMSTEQLGVLMEKDGGGAEIFRRMGGSEGIAKALGAAHPTAMAELSQSLSGRWATVKDAFEKGVAEGFKPIIPRIKTLLEKAAPMIEKASMAFGHGLDKFSTMIGRINFQPLLGAGKSAYQSGVEWYQRNLPNLKAVAANIGELFFEAGRVIKEVFWPYLVDIFKILAPGISLLFKGLVVTFRFIADHAKVFRTVLLATAVVAAGMVGWPALIAAGFLLLYNRSQLFRRVVHLTWTIFVALLKVTWLLVKPLVQIVALIAKVLAKPVGWWWDVMVDTVDGVVSGIEMIVQMVDDLIHKNPFASWKLPGGETGQNVASALFKGALVAGSGGLGALALPFLGDSHSPVMFGHSSNFHQAMSSRVPGSFAVTSGYRTTNLGSSNSDHLRGAYDVIGHGLHAYAQLVAQSGGWAEFHGGGSHLHVVPPMGDSSSPRGRSADVAMVQNNYFTVNARTPADGEAAIVRAVNKMRRDAIERAGATP